MRLRTAKLVPYLTVAMLAGSCLCFGSWFHDSSVRNTNVTFSQRTRFKNGTVLPAGEYRMEVPKGTQQPDVKFYKVYMSPYGSQSSIAGNAAVSVPATVVNTAKKNANTEILSSTHGDVQVVRAILPAGWNQKLIFSRGHHNVS